MRALADLAVRLQEKLTLDAMLAVVVECAADALGCPHTSLRLLDAARTRLMVTARAGRSAHDRADASFAVGEGLVGWIAATSKPVRVGDAPADPRFAARSDLRVKIRSVLGVPLIASGTCIGVLSAAAPEVDAFTVEHEQILMLVAAICAPRLEVARLERLAGIDPLTGALNRRGMDDAIGAHGIAPPLAVAMIDIDHFKLVNDVHGHGVGDEVLRHVPAVLGSIVRSSDSIVRWGGEEFVLTLPNVAPVRALAIAERARAAFDGSPVATAAGDIAITISVGVASMRADEPWDALLERADQALYRAKSGGRNRVVADESTP
ncbi:MAG: sensor domain-containing diguanylate cyclase [Myxococcota bacterium]|nr:sensor domain-containing diguanylate cyclase [Myxococcota bacterium]